MSARKGPPFDVLFSISTAGCFSSLASARETGGASMPSFIKGSSRREDGDRDISLNGVSPRHSPFGRERSWTRRPQSQFSLSRMPLFSRAGLDPRFHSLPVPFLCTFIRGNEGQYFLFISPSSSSSPFFLWFRFSGFPFRGSVTSYIVFRKE